MEEPQSLRVLLVEDNPSDVVIFREALATADLAVDLEIAWNGQQALDRLRQQGGQAPAPRPDMVVLDVNLPVLSGRELLAQMGADGDLNTIPVVILTGSRFEKDTVALYRQDLSMFVVKPFDFLSLVEVARRIVGFAAALRSGTP